MLGMLVASHLNLLGGGSAWRQWVDYILKQTKYGVKQVALLYGSGDVASTSKGFSVSQEQLEVFQQILADPSLKPESIRVNGQTFIIKSADKNQVTAFNGSKYLIVSRSNNMFIVTVCKIRRRKDSETSAAWMRTLTDTFRIKGY